MRAQWMLGLALATAATAGTASAQEMIVNGGFETGDLTGWTRQVWPNSNGDILVVGAGPGFQSGLPQIGPRTGTRYALTDQGGPGAYSLRQAFTVSSAPASATLRFALSVTSYATPTTPGTAFDPVGPARQFARVDLFSSLLADGFSSAAPLQTFFAGPGTAVGSPQPWQLFSFDLTSLLAAAGTYTLRFTEVDNQGNFNLGIDDVSLVATPTQVIPEPTTFALVGGALAALGLAARRRAA
jgi:hypothetical protein